MVLLVMHSLRLVDQLYNDGSAHLMRTPRGHTEETGALRVTDSDPDLLSEIRSARSKPSD